MDAVKILGSLLEKNALGSKTGGSILESLLGGGESPRGKAPATTGGAGDILSTLLGGKKGSGKGGTAALAAILAALAATNGKGKGGSGGGLGDLLGGLAGSDSKGGGASGGLGDMLGGLLGGGKGGASPDLGGLLGSLLGGGGGAPGLQGGEGPPPLDPAGAEEGAQLLIEAMCLAAKCGGSVDEDEREAIVGRLGELDEEESAFLKKHLASRIQVETFAKRVPAEMAGQVYAFALMAVRLDSRKEAEWFARLAQGLGLDGEAANDIHTRLGQPEIFA